MNNQKEKRHGGEAVASEAPENPNPCEVHSQIASESFGNSLLEFPPSAWKASADWHLKQANGARCPEALKYHMRLWAMRWACYMRSLRGGWHEHAHVVFNSAATASQLDVRFRKHQVLAFCQRVNHVVWGED